MRVSRSLIFKYAAVILGAYYFIIIPAVTAIMTPFRGPSSAQSIGLSMMLFQNAGVFMDEDGYSDFRGKCLYYVETLRTTFALLLFFFLSCGLYWVARKLVFHGLCFFFLVVLAVDGYYRRVIDFPVLAAGIYGVAIALVMCKHEPRPINDKHTLGGL